MAKNQVAEQLVDQSVGRGFDPRLGLNVEVSLIRNPRLLPVAVNAKCVLNRRATLNGSVWINVWMGECESVECSVDQKMPHVYKYIYQLHPSKAFRKPLHNPKDSNQPQQLIWVLCVIFRGVRESEVWHLELFVTFLEPLLNGSVLILQ